jgi:hypothetical protein
MSFATTARFAFRSSFTGCTGFTFRSWFARWSGGAWRAGVSVVTLADTAVTLTGLSGFWSVLFGAYNFRPSFIGHYLEFVHTSFQFSLNTGSLLIDDRDEGQAAEHSGDAYGDGG